MLMKQSPDKKRVFEKNIDFTKHDVFEVIRRHKNPGLFITAKCEVRQSKVRWHKIQESTKDLIVSEDTKCTWTRNALIEIHLYHFISTKKPDNSGAQLGGRRAADEIWKLQKVPWFKQKKGPDCIHLWAKFSIQNIGLGVSRRKNSKTFPCGAFYSWVFNELWNCPNSTKPFLPWTISSCPPLMIYRFAVQLISPTLNLWKLLFSLPNVCKKSCRTQKTYLYSLKG